MPTIKGIPVDEKFVNDIITRVNKDGVAKVAEHLADMVHADQTNLIEITKLEAEQKYYRLKKITALVKQVLDNERFI